MLGTQNPGGDRGGIGKRTMRGTEEEEIEAGEREQFGHEQDRDFTPIMRPTCGVAHFPLFFAQLRSSQPTTANVPAKAVNERITIATNQAPATDMRDLLALEVSRFCHGAPISGFDGCQSEGPKVELFE
jgi:hypothetical protein